MKRFVAILVLCNGLLGPLDALDLSGALHVDTYAGSPTVGFSFLGQENITRSLSMRAQADYLTANAYEVRTLVVGSLSRLSLGGGFALGIKAGEEQAIVPGVEALFGMRVTPRLEAETSVMLTFSPANLSQIHDLRGKLKFMYKTANSTSTVGYTLVKGFLPHTDDFVNSLYMRVDAFEENFPIGLTLGSGIDFLLTSNDRRLDVHVAGGLTFITKKHGIYFGRVKMGILSHREDNGLPYDISVGASFSL